MKKTFLYLSIFIFLVSFVQFFGCTLKRDAVTYVALHLNPSIELVLDTSNRVISVNALNDEGELLLSAENFEGKEIKRVVQQLLAVASRSGLFDVESLNGLVSLTVVNENAQFSNTIFGELKELCENYFKTNGIYALVASAALPDEIVELSQEHNIPVAHLLLMLKLQNYRPDLEFLEIATMPIKDIIKALNNELITVGKIYNKQQKQEYKTQLNALRQTYEQNLKLLFGNEYVALLDELELLKSQIDTVELEQLENLKNAISAKVQQIEVLRSSLETTYQTEYQALKLEHQTQVQELKATYINETKQELQTFKTAIQNRISEHKHKLQTKIDFARNRSNNFKQNYETFLALRENDLYNFFKTKLQELEQLENQTEDEFNTIILKVKNNMFLYNS